MTFETRQLSDKPDYLAPDGSEIRKFPDVRGRGLCHCTLPPKATSQAISHKTMDEIWYVIESQGEVWRKSGKHEETAREYPGLCLTIPVGIHFQFLNTVPLKVISAAMPPWPDPQEAVKVADHWQSK